MGDQSIRAALETRFDELVGRATHPIDVAVVDSGIDATHPDLASRIAGTYSINTEGDEPQIVEHAVPANQDCFGHGTAVASIIARLAPNARLVDVRVLEPGNQGSGAALVAGLRLVTARRWRLVNMSLAATGRFATVLNELCETAYRQNQVVVASKRNSPFTDLGFPAEFSSSISVDRGNFPTPYDIRYLDGSPIEYAAHGDEVVCAAAGGGYTTKTGTSFATPVMTALCALLLGAFPDLKLFELKTILKAYATGS
jgi:subtilisin family serine protease